MSPPLEPIHWDDKKFSVGITKIDEQHKQLVGLLNSLILNKNKDDREFTAKVLNTLLIYIRTHFTDEEKMLRKINFPGYKEHVKEHVTFTNQIFESKLLYEKTQHSPVVLENLLPVLSHWLTNHILKKDMAYAQYLIT